MIWLVCVCVYVCMKESETVLDPWGAHAQGIEWCLADWEFVLGYDCKLESMGFFFFFSKREEEDLVTEGGGERGGANCPGARFGHEWGGSCLRDKSYWKGRVAQKAAL